MWLQRIEVKSASGRNCGAEQAEWTRWACSQWSQSQVPSSGSGVRPLTHRASVAATIPRADHAPTRGSTDLAVCQASYTPLDELEKATKTSPPAQQGLTCVIEAFFVTVKALENRRQQMVLAFHNTAAGLWCLVIEVEPRAIVRLIVDHFRITARALHSCQKKGPWSECHEMLLIGLLQGKGQVQSPCSAMAYASIAQAASIKISVIAVP